MRETNGFGENARHADYHYGEAIGQPNYGKLVRVDEPTGNYTRYEYDAAGRVVLAVSPTAIAGYVEKGTRTTYATTSDRFNDHRPATVKDVLITASGNEVVMATTTYSYDNIGNRKTAQEDAEEATTYTANNLNQYTAIQEGTAEAFEPTSDADGTTATVICHQLSLHRGYLQIAALVLTTTSLPAQHFLLWDPTQPVATRPLAIRKNGTWYTFGWELTKNICESARRPRLGRLHQQAVRAIGLVCMWRMCL